MRPDNAHPMTSAHTTAVCVLLLGAFSTFSSVQAGPPLSVASPAVGATTLPAAYALPLPTRVGKYTVEEWREEIDRHWGAGAETSEKLRIFDLAWNELDREYGAYMNLDVDMQALRTKYRQEISGGVSKGRFAIVGGPTTFYDKPIAVLIGPGAVSNGDWESLRMGYHSRVRTFGKPTNGAFTLSDFPDLGTDWYFSKATGSGYLVDGHVYLAHTGVQPDTEVWLERKDVAAGRDTVVDAAVQWIEGRRPRRVRGRALP